MTRIFTDGAEFGDILFWDAPGSSTAASAAQQRSGIYSYYIYSTNVKLLPSPLSELYFRVAFFPGTASSNYFITFMTGGTNIIRIRCNSLANTLDAYVSTSTLVESGAISYNVDEWSLLEVYIKIADSGGRIVTKLNGVVDIDYTGDTKPGADTTVDRIIINEFSSGDRFVDDLALNDTNGSAPDNTWCGDGHVEVLMPNNNGDVNDWDGSDGDSVNNYLLVDERPHDTDTTYVKTGVTEQDMYNVADYDPTGGKIVRRIWAECRAKDNTALSGTIKLGYKHGGTVYLSSAKILSSNYARVVGDEALSDPSDSTVWSEADLDSIQFVVECSSSSSSTTSSSSSSTTTSSSSSTEIP